MSERGTFRGGPRGGRGGRGGARGRGGGGAAGGGADRAQGQQQQEKPKKENILDLTKYMDKEVCVKFNGGREGTSILFSSPCFVDTCVVSGFELILLPCMLYSFGIPLEMHT